MFFQKCEKFSATKTNFEVSTKLTEAKTLLANYQSFKEASSFGLFVAFSCYILNLIFLAYNGIAVLNGCRLGYDVRTIGLPFTREQN